jgi:hypothetical protein
MAERRQALAFFERRHRVREKQGQYEDQAAQGNPVWE